MKVRDAHPFQSVNFTMDTKTMFHLLITGRLNDHSLVMRPLNSWYHGNDLFQTHKYILKLRWVRGGRWGLGQTNSPLAIYLKITMSKRGKWGLRSKKFTIGMIGKYASTYVDDSVRTCHSEKEIEVLRDLIVVLQLISLVKLFNFMLYFCTSVIINNTHVTVQYVVGNYT